MSMPLFKLFYAQIPWWENKIRRRTVPIDSIEVGCNSKNDKKDDIA